ncbi:unnamed protein product [Pieris macdunnoughi]|uniref:unspecific monooxygenase n=1 Tax=Pieris macdunnoughi TaxID=345717 RepID=A0A821VEP6_9NEOP|nr:unnamed protein product [Pieris macdunnoughi]
MLFEVKHLLLLAVVVIFLTGQTMILDTYNIVFYALLVFVAFYFYCSYKLNYWRRRGVQQLKNTNLLFGDFKKGILFQSPPGYHMGNLYRQSPRDAPFVGFYIFHKPCLLLKDSEVIKQILSRDFENFSDRSFSGSEQKDSSGMINLFGLRNPAWRSLRKKITPTFTLCKLKQLLTFMTESGDPMMEFLCKNVDEDGEVKVIDVQDTCYKYTADLFANVSLGSRTDSFNDKNSDYLRYFKKYFHSFRRMIAIVTVFFIPELVKVVGSSILFDSTYLRKLFWSAVRLREKSGIKRGDFLDTLIQLKNEEQDPLYEFNEHNLFSQTGTYLAGLETSSNVTAFTLMELAKNSEYQDRARECIKTAIAQHGWTVEAFNNMKYLDQVIAEGLRLHPSVSTLDREALHDYKIPNTDIVIEAGTAVYISLFGTHRDPKFFDRPEEFDPDRFTEDKKVSDNYLAFGSGPRQCIGVKAGQLYMKVVLSMILLKYKLNHKQTEDLQLDRRATFTTAAKGINLEFVKIQ